MPAAIEQALERARRDREACVRRSGATKPAAVALERELTRLQDPAVVVAQDGQQHRVA